MPAGRQHEVLVVGQAFWPSPAHHAHGQVLIDDDHVWRRGPCSGHVGVAAEDGVSLEVGVEGSLEFVGQVTGADPSQHLSSFGGQTWVTGPAALAALF